jgi:putative aminopeptidase FrvX
MDERQFTFLRELTETAGPSGYEGPVRAVWRTAVQDFAADVQTDSHGSVTAVVNPGGAPKVMLAGHIDEIGLMVTFIDEQGFLHFSPIGGHDPVVLVGQRVRVHTSTGSLLGVIGRKPIHLMRGDDRTAPVEIHHLWIDIGAKDREDAAAAVHIGDPVTFDRPLERLRNDLLVAKSFDNRVGAYVAAEAARAVATGPLQAAVYAVATCQEEIGYRGAITSAERIQPDVAIAIDVGFGLDHPYVEDERKRRGATSLGKGPQITRGANVSPVVFRLLLEAADAEHIPYQIDPTPGESGTDIWAIQVAHHGIATGALSVSLRYMHSPVEVLAISDLDQTVALLAAFIRRLTSQANFIPE